MKISELRFKILMTEHYKRLSEEMVSNLGQQEDPANFPMYITSLMREETKQNLVSIEDRERLMEILLEVILYHIVSLVRIMEPHSLFKIKLQCQMMTTHGL